MKTSRVARYAAARSQRMFLGDLLKYVKGDWERGPDRVPVPPGETFIAVMGTTTVGYLKWIDGKMVDHKMGLAADGFIPVPRRDLDDYDSKSWKVDNDGDLIDPWQPTSLLVLISQAEPHELFTFSTSTAGGESAVGELCEAHARTTEDAGLYPVVMLASDSYLHKIKSRGRVYVPVFNIVDAVDAAPFDAIVAGARGGAGFIPISPPADLTSGTGPFAIANERRGPPKPPEHDEPPSPDPDDPGPGKLDDDIPF
jgi:hypothetical protein